MSLFCGVRYFRLQGKMIGTDNSLQVLTLFVIITAVVCGDINNRHCACLEIFLDGVHYLDKMFRGQTHEHIAADNIELHIAIEVLY